MGRMTADLMNPLVLCSPGNPALKCRLESLNYILKTLRKLSANVWSLSLPKQHLVMPMGQSTTGHNFFLVIIFLMIFLVKDVVFTVLKHF